MPSAEVAGPGALRMMPAETSSDTRTLSALFFSAARGVFGLPKICKNWQMGPPCRSQRYCRSFQNCILGKTEHSKVHQTQKG